MSYVELSALDLGLAALLLVINGAISLAFGLRFGTNLVFAAVRMAVQLIAVGLVLKFVFAQGSPLWTLLVALVMALMAAFELSRGQERRLGARLAQGLGSATLLVVGGLATLYATAAVIGPDPWYAPRYVLPIFGMVLGNMLTSVSLALRSLAEGAERERTAIEARIALGGSRLEAFAGVVRHAVRLATTPLLNAMSVAGIATLPGVMAGQILAGADPAEAAKYQIVIMLVMSAASALGAVAAALGGVLLLTDGRHRLRLDRFAGGALGH